MGTPKKKKHPITLPSPSPTTLIKAQVLVVKMASKKKCNKWPKNSTKPAMVQDKSSLEDLTGDLPRNHILIK